MQIVQFFPIPILVAIIAFIWIFVANTFGWLSWVAFITWGAFFLTAINTKSAIREAISFTIGILFGMAIVFLATAIGPTFGQFAFPAVVALAAFIIVYLELVPWFDMAPGYFLGCASYFAAGAKLDMTIFLAVLIPGILGIGLGIVTAYLRKQVLKLEGTSDPMQKKAESK